MRRRHFDVILLGCGAASKNIGPALARAGYSVLMIERQYMGGSCPNIACLPSKNLVYSAKHIHEAKQARLYGLPADTGQVDIATVRERIASMVRSADQFYSERFAAAGVEFIWADGRMVGPHTLELTKTTGTEQVDGDFVVINTGSRSTIPDINGLRESGPMTPVELLQLERLPEHLIILGAGYVGLEFAQALRRLGSRVTVIDRNDEILKQEDKEFTRAIRKTLEEEGVCFLLGQQVDSIRGQSGSRVQVSVSREMESMEVEGSDILVALGRSPNTQGLGLEENGIRMRPDGTIDVDEFLQTSVPNVFAAGDCAGSPNFTHIAFDDYRVIAAAIRNEQKRSIVGRQVPFCLYTDPEFCRVGLSEVEAVGRGLSYRTLTLPVASIGKSQTTGNVAGTLRALVDDADRIIGFEALGEGVGELLAPIQIAMKSGMTYREVGEMIFTHPTLSEGLMSLCQQEPKPPQTARSVTP